MCFGFVFKDEPSVKDDFPMSDTSFPEDRIKEFSKLTDRDLILHVYFAVQNLDKRLSEHIDGHKRFFWILVSSITGCLIAGFFTLMNMIR